MSGRDRKARVEEALSRLLELIEDAFKGRFSTDFGVEDEIDALAATVQVALARRRVPHLRAEGFDSAAVDRVRARLAKCMNLQTSIAAISGFRGHLDPDRFEEQRVARVCEELGLDEEAQRPIRIAVFRLYTCAGRPSKAAEGLCAELIKHPTFEDAWIARAEAFLEMEAYGLADIQLSQPSVRSSHMVSNLQQIAREKMQQQTESLESICGNLQSQFSAEELYSQATILKSEGSLFSSLAHAVAATMGATDVLFKAIALLSAIRVINCMKAASDDLLMDALQACDYGIRLDRRKARSFIMERCILLFKLGDYKSAFDESLALVECSEQMRSINMLCRKFLKLGVHSKTINLSGYAIGKVLQSDRIFHRAETINRRKNQVDNVLVKIVHDDFLWNIKENTVLCIGHFRGNVDDILKLSHPCIHVMDFRKSASWNNRFVNLIKTRLHNTGIQCLISSASFCILGLNAYVDDISPVDENEETLLIDSADVIATLSGLVGGPPSDAGRDLSQYVIGSQSIRPLIVKQFQERPEPFPTKKISSGFLKGCLLEVGPRFRIRGPPKVDKEDPGRGHMINLTLSAAASVAIFAVGLSYYFFTPTNS